MGNAAALLQAISIRIFKFSATHFEFALGYIAYFIADGYFTVHIPSTCEQDFQILLHLRLHITSNLERIKSVVWQRIVGSDLKVLTLIQCFFPCSEAYTTKQAQHIQSFFNNSILAHPYNEDCAQWYYKAGYQLDKSAQDIWVCICEGSCKTPEATSEDQPPL